MGPVRRAVGRLHAPAQEPAAHACKHRQDLSLEVGPKDLGVVPGDRSASV